MLTLIPEQSGFMARMEIMSGTQRRRRWSQEAKFGILAQADEPGARISDVARRHDIHPGQIRLWRQSFSYVDRPTVFLPVDITKEVGVSQPSTAVTRRAIFEILLRNGRCLKVPIDVELKLLGPLVETVVTEAPSSDAIFGFHGKGADRIKLLWWDGQGLCLFYKILERGYFPCRRRKRG